MIELFLPPPVRTKLVEGNLIEALPYGHYQVEYYPAVVDRTVDRVHAVRLMNLRPRAILCGFRAYVSLIAFLVADAERAAGRRVDPVNLQLNLYDDGAEYSFLELPVYYAPDLGHDHDVTVACGAGRAVIEAASRSSIKR